MAPMINECYGAEGYGANLEEAKRWGWVCPPILKRTNAGSGIMTEVRGYQAAKKKKKRRCVLTLTPSLAAASVLRQGQGRPVQELQPGRNTRKAVPPQAQLKEQPLPPREQQHARHVQEQRCQLPHGLRAA